MSTIWPKPHDAEVLFTRALLIHGPLPQYGWSVRRDQHCDVLYVTSRGEAAHKFRHAIVKMFTEEVERRYAIHDWKGHNERLAQHWKNLFLVWIWRKVDEK